MVDETGNIGGYKFTLRLDDADDDFVVPITSGSLARKSSEVVRLPPIESHCKEYSLYVTLKKDGKLAEEFPSPTSRNSFDVLGFYLDEKHYLWGQDVEFRFYERYIGEDNAGWREITKHDLITRAIYSK